MAYTGLYDEGIRWAYISADGTYIQRASPVKLIRVVLNGDSAANGIITIYNNSAASGEVVSILYPDALNFTCYEFGVSLSTGLTVVAASLAGDANCTVVYQ